MADIRKSFGIRTFMTSQDRRLVRVRLLMIFLLSILAAATACYYALRPRTYVLLVPAEQAAFIERLEAWSSFLVRREAPFRVHVRPVADRKTALSDLLSGSAALGVVRVDDATPGEIRSIVILSKRPIFVGPSLGDDADARYIEARGRSATPPLKLTLLRETEIAEAKLQAPPDLSGLHRQLPFLVQMSAPQAQAKGAASDVDTLALTTQMVALDNLSKSQGSDLARWVENGRKQLTGDQAISFAKHEEDDGLRAHDGVATFKMREDSSFLAQNSDLLYIGMATLGAIASLIGAIAANIRSKLRDGGVRFIGRLETLTKELRVADDVERVYRIADAGLEIAQKFAHDLAAHKVERRVDLSFKMLYDAFRGEVDLRLAKLNPQPPLHTKNPAS